VIDLGPEGGAGGGAVVAIGTPEQVANDPASHTATFLREILAQEPQAARPTVARVSKLSSTKSAAGRSRAAGAK
jgi:excinuclease ABC subunit A